MATHCQLSKYLPHDNNNSNNDMGTPLPGIQLHVSIKETTKQTTNQNTSAFPVVLHTLTADVQDLIQSLEL